MLNEDLSASAGAALCDTVGVSQQNCAGWFGRGDKENIAVRALGNKRGVHILVCGACCQMKGGKLWGMSIGRQSMSSVSATA